MQLFEFLIRVCVVVRIVCSTNGRLEDNFLLSMFALITLFKAWSSFITIASQKCGSPAIYSRYSCSKGFWHFHSWKLMHCHFWFFRLRSPLLCRHPASLPRVPFPLCSMFWPLALLINRYGSVNKSACRLVIGENNWKIHGSFRLCSRFFLVEKNWVSLRTSSPYSLFTFEFFLVWKVHEVSRNFLISTGCFENCLIIT